jgi:hypothetical protein
MISILEADYVEPNRPISVKELTTTRDSLYKYLKLSETKSLHDKCRHFYYVKENGRKEKEIKEKNTNENVGNCSVCWKLSKTPKRLKDRAYDLVDDYSNQFYNEPEVYNYNLLDLERTFYKWLYQENYENEDDVTTQKRYIKKNNRQQSTE